MNVIIHKSTEAKNNIALKQMQKQGIDDNFTILQDCFSPEYNKQRKPANWGHFAQTIEKFDQIRVIESNQIEENLKEIFQRKQQYLNKFIDYKSSILHQKENKQNELLFIKPEELQQFFKDDLKHISAIVKLFAQKPQLLSPVLLKCDSLRTFNYRDFTINMMNLFYAHYFLQEKSGTSSQLYAFISAVFRDWNYDVEHVRMLQGSSHNDMVSAFFKHPTAECLVEKLAVKFIAEMEISDSFNFDLAFIQVEVQSRKAKLKTNVQPQKQSFFDKFKRTFTQSKVDQQQSKRLNEQAANNRKQALAIQKQRQEKFISVLRKSAQIILCEQLPHVCRIVLQAFRQKLKKEIPNQQDFTRHYCYLIFSTWILSEFNIKFTMSHDEKGTMTNVDLQNVSEILRALTMVFQCIQPHDKAIFYRHVIAQYKPRVKYFYSKALQLFDQSPESQKDSLLVQYEHTLKILSLNDIFILSDLVKTAKKFNIPLALPTDQSFEFKDSNFLIRSKDYKPQNIYIMFKINRQEVLQKINAFALGTVFPLQQMPLLTNALLKYANLSVGQSQQVLGNIEYFRKLRSQQILFKFENLKMSKKIIRILDTQVFDKELIAAFQSRIKISLLNKCAVIRRKNNICTQINNTIMIIDLYRNRLKSDSFYRNVTHKFVTQMKVELYIVVEENKLKICTTLPQSQKKLHLSNILMAQKPQETKVMNRILTTTYKKFESLEKLIEAVAQTDVAKKALINGRRTEQFNDFFCSLCEAAMDKVPEFLNQQLYIQRPDPSKFKGLLQERLGQLLFKQMNLQDQLEKDRSFSRRMSQIDQMQFYDKQLGDLSIQAFLFDQAISQFNKIDSKHSAKEKIDQFDHLVKIIFSVTSLTISRQKISAQIITPIIQFVILKAQPQNCFKNLFIVQCLLGEYTPETSYLITLWASAVTYLNELNPQSLNGSRMSISCLYDSGSGGNFSSRNSMR